MYEGDDYGLWLSGFLFGLFDDLFAVFAMCDDAAVLDCDVFATVRFPEAFHVLVDPLAVPSAFVEEFFCGCSHVVHPDRYAGRSFVNLFNDSFGLSIKRNGLA
jgi:hypothetical protein